MFVFDIDGTLLTSNEQIPQSTFKSLKKLKAAGNPITICTGRTWACTKPIINQLPSLVDFVICGNGSHIRTNQGQILYDNNLPPNFIKGFFELVFGVTDFLIATNRMVISTSTDTPYNDVDHCMKLFDTELFHERIHAKNLLAFNIDRVPYKERTYIRNKLETLDPEVKLSPLSDFWEVLSGVDNKATALKTLSNQIGIPLKRFTAFGDNFNDLDMFEVVGTAVAMGNAPEAVKKSAHYVTASNNQDGIYRYLRKHVL
ncbi:HAD family hydrolase [Ammoniphilus resinae]|uniref:Cof subfamily protein (Haloacid dehalogenase superfamily) n=1 Tax=Ammoniphilus resinae TaxID=861532 RepID=A0ABS4GK55_9BACL|nr:HAD family hydrolase [Ammoniphilus resinae]MBP1930631.1 Cof subfamily protein (haloacid dehalogenase superfamily) [Ammoniphilus resinae]